MRKDRLRCGGEPPPGTRADASAGASSGASSGDEEEEATSWSTPLELRVPSAQRTWVGVGCAAGVAAAFNAPLGGILYSFEEVCSAWSSKLT